MLNQSEQVNILIYHIIMIKLYHLILWHWVARWRHLEPHFKMHFWFMLNRTRFQYCSLVQSTGVFQRPNFIRTKRLLHRYLSGQFYSFITWQCDIMGGLKECPVSDIVHYISQLMSTGSTLWRYILYTAHFHFCFWCAVRRWLQP